MRKSLIISIAMLLASSAIQQTSFAADLSYKAPPMAQIIATPIQDWTGFYLGVDGGYGWGNGTIDSPVTVTGVTFTSPFANPTSSGGIIGGHAGYNWQYNNIVGGLEMDYDAANINGSQTIVPSRTTGLTSASLATSIDQLATVRGRLGITPMTGLLVYATAGVAYGHTEATVSGTTGGRVPITATANAFNNNFGWVAGGGAEFKVYGPITVRAEYLHYDFGEVGYAFPIVAAIGANSHITADVIRAGLSYKF